MAWSKKNVERDEDERRRCAERDYWEAVEMNVEQVFAGGVFSRDQVEAFKKFELDVLASLSEAKNVGVPQGLLVALLQGHATKEALVMMEDL